MFFYFLYEWRLNGFGLYVLYLQKIFQQLREL